jgi:hypothetical protein
MNIVIPSALKKQITKNRALFAVSESEYIRNALVHYDHLLHLDAQLQDELRQWDKTATDDFNMWTQKQRL